MLRIGLLGYGYWGPILTKCFFETGNPVSVIADRHEEKATQIKALYGDVLLTSNLDQTVNDSALDAVIIALPTSLHYEYCKKALLSGKHLFVEKPFTRTPSEALELATLADSLGLCLMVDHHFIYKDSIEFLKEKIDQGQLGRLTFYDSVRENQGVFRRDDDVVFDLCPHDLSILKYVTNSNPDRVIATGSCNVFNQIIDKANISLMYETGLSANISVSWIMPKKIRDIYFFGTKAVAYYNDNETQDTIKLAKVFYEQSESGIISCSNNGWCPVFSEKTNAIHAAIEDFVCCIGSGKRPRSNGFFGYDIMKTIFAIEQSMHQNGKLVLV